MAVSRFLLFLDGIVYSQSISSYISTTTKDWHVGHVKPMVEDELWFVVEDPVVSSCVDEEVALWESLVVEPSVELSVV